MKLGISTYTYTWAIGVPDYETPVRPMTATALLETAAEQGAALVQFADNLPLHHMTVTELDDLYRQAEQMHLSLEVGTRGTSPELLMRYLDIAVRMASPIVRTLITTPDIEAGEHDIRQVLREYESSGVTLAVENHGLHTTGQLTKMFDRLNSAAVGCCLDTVNSFSALQAPDQVVRELSPYTVCLHVKDFEIKRIDHQMGFVIIGTPAGQGRLDIESIMHEVSRYGRCQSAILELWTPYTKHVEQTIAMEDDWCRQSMDYLKSRI